MQMEKPQQHSSAQEKAPQQEKNPTRQRDWLCFTWLVSPILTLIQVQFKLEFLVSVFELVKCFLKGWK